MNTSLKALINNHFTANNMDFAAKVTWATNNCPTDMKYVDFIRQTVEYDVLTLARGVYNTSSLQYLFEHFVAYLEEAALYKLATQVGDASVFYNGKTLYLQMENVDLIELTKVRMSNELPMKYLCTKAGKYINAHSWEILRDAVEA